jgi:hypothetical protein
LILQSGKMLAWCIGIAASLASCKSRSDDLQESNISQVEAISKTSNADYIAFALFTGALYSFPSEMIWEKFQLAESEFGIVPGNFAPSSFNQRFRVRKTLFTGGLTNAVLERLNPVSIYHNADTVLTDMYDEMVYYFGNHVDSENSIGVTVKLEPVRDSWSTKKKFPTAVWRLSLYFHTIWLEFVRPQQAKKLEMYRTYWERTFPRERENENPLDEDLNRYFQRSFLIDSKMNILTPDNGAFEIEE